MQKKSFLTNQDRLSLTHFGGGAWRVSGPDGYWRGDLGYPIRTVNARTVATALGVIGQSSQCQAPRLPSARALTHVPAAPGQESE